MLKVNTMKKDKYNKNTGMINKDIVLFVNFGKVIALCGRIFRTL